MRRAWRLREKRTFGERVSFLQSLYKFIHLIKMETAHLDLDNGDVLYSVVLTVVRLAGQSIRIARRVR